MTDIPGPDVDLIENFTFFLSVCAFLKNKTVMTRLILCYMTDVFNIEMISSTIVLVMFHNILTNSKEAKRKEAISII